MHFKVNLLKNSFILFCFVFGAKKTATERTEGNSLAKVLSLFIQSQNVHNKIVSLD